MERGTKRTLSFALAVALLVSLVACNTVKGNGSPATSAAQSFKEGTYTATAKGHGGDVTVRVTFSRSAIESVVIAQADETSGVGAPALMEISDKIVKGQTLDIDAVSGATSSSDAILAAVADCVTQAGGNLAALKTSAAKKPAAARQEQLIADIVVVGAGASGVSAAIAAADKGAKVILIEKTKAIGGASNFSWAAKFVNSSVALKNGPKLDTEKMITDWIVGNHWRVDAADVRQYFNQSGATYDWLEQKGYHTTFLQFGQDQLHMLPAYESRQGTLVKMLADSVEKNGGQVLTETKAQKLLTDKAGDVVGVVAAKADGSTVEIRAKAVIIATGGYAGDAEMVKKYSGFQGPLGGLGQNVGEGIKMGWAAGAEVPRNFGVQMVHQTLTDATADLKKKYDAFEASYPLMLSYLPSVMNVGPSGARFRDEAAVLTPDSSAITSVYNGPYHVVIVSKSQLDALETSGMHGIKAASLPAMPPEFYLAFKDRFTLDQPWKEASKVLDTMVSDGQGYKGSTPAELAKNAGLDVATFTQEFANYEAAAKAGVDDEFGKAPSYLVPMGQGPYYAIVAKVNNLGSVGGLSVNKSFQVLNSKRAAIKGLYAVGLDSEGVLFGDAYTGMGDGLGYAFTSGRLAGAYAADGALGKR